MLKTWRVATRGIMAFAGFASLGCSDISTAVPTYGPVPQPVPPQAPPPAPPSYPLGPPPPFPAVVNAIAIYVGPEHLYDVFKSYHGSSVPSRYVLYSDSTFQLQFSSFRFGVTSSGGHYSRTESTLSFSWTSGGGPPWDAVGIVQGDTLYISYSLNMQMSDYLDGAYVLVR